MWVKNVLTGLEWEVSEEHGKVLLKDEDYEVVAEPKQESEEYLALKKFTVAQLIEQYGEKVPEAGNLKKDELIAAILALPAE